MLAAYIENIDDKHNHHHHTMLESNETCELKDTGHSDVSIPVPPPHSTAFMTNPQTYNLQVM